ncbi:MULTISPECIES: hypothetical protein [unclassified Bradyrhizobium]|uniref:hypothetical protein n=1 Tax=unclassified Bradyrhizobium TaxID=2631580 RepID=UPI0028F03299|nr:MULTISPECIES: hypothetical protein [unclassified Bradyrhizobium]
MSLSLMRATVAGYGLASIDRTLPETFTGAPVNLSRSTCRQQGTPMSSPWRITIGPSAAQASSRR